MSRDPDVWDEDDAFQDWVMTEQEDSVSNLYYSLSPGSKDPVDRDLWFALDAYLEKEWQKHVEEENERRYGI